jgi:hypothetical protein
VIAESIAQNDQHEAMLPGDSVIAVQAGCLTSVVAKAESIPPGLAAFRRVVVELRLYRWMPAAYWSG